MNKKSLAQWSSFSLALAFCLSACGGGGVGEGGNSAAVEPTPTPVGTKLKFDSLNILVIGQSISSNCNEHMYGPVANVFQVALDGSVKPAQDPFEWADCKAGAIWIPLGRQLIDAKVANKVTFMPIGVGGSKAQDWQVGGSNFNKLNRAISLITDKGLKVDMAFWYQGSSDVGTDPSEYSARLASVVDYVSNKIKVDRWVIALHSRCGVNYSPQIEAAQFSFGNNPQFHRYVGPNNNLLGDEYRMVDKCHLNQLGQEKMASLWFDSIAAITY